MTVGQGRRAGCGARWALGIWPPWEAPPFLGTPSRVPASVSSTQHLSNHVEPAKPTGTQALLHATARSEGVHIDSLVVTVKTGPNEGRGTWVHEDIALDVARWLSPDFHAYLLKTMRRYLKGEVTTEESKRAKKAYDALLSQSRIKYEQALQQLTDTKNELEAKKGGNRRLGELLGSARDKADELQIKLDKTKKKETKKSRSEDKFHFISRLREAIKLYVADRTTSTPEAEEGFGEDADGLPMTIPKFVQGLEEHHKNSDGLGKDWSLFNETPGQGWNIVPLIQAVDDQQSIEDFCRHTNFVAGFNHLDKKKVLQEIGDEMFTAPVTNKRARRS